MVIEIKKYSMAAYQSMGDFKKHVWDLTSRTLKVAKGVLNVVHEAGQENLFYREKVCIPLKNSVYGIKVLSGISLPYNIDSVFKGIFGLQGAYTLGDFEGLLYSTVGLTLDTLDTIDESTSLYKLFFEVDPNWAIAPLFIYGLEIVFALVSLSLCNRMAHLFQTRSFSVELKELIEQNRETSLEEFHTNLENFLQEKVGLSEKEQQMALENEIERIKSVKGKRLIRRSSPEIQKAFAELLPIVEKGNFSEKDAKKMRNILGQASEALERKKTFHNYSAFHSLVSLVGVSLFLAPVGLIVPFSLMAVSSSMKLWLFLNTDHFEKANIELNPLIE